MKSLYLTVIHLYMKAKIGSKESQISIIKKYINLFGYTFTMYEEIYDVLVKLDDIKFLQDII